MRCASLLFPRRVVLGALLLGSVGLGPLAGAAQQAGAAVPTPGSAAPPWRLRDLDGRVHAGAAYRGKTLVLYWWSATSPAAALVDPLVAALARRWERRGVVFLAVCPFPCRGGERRDGECERLLREFLRLRGLAMPLLLDPDRSVSRRFGIRRLPAAVVVDPRGRLCYRGAVIPPRSRPGERGYVVFLERVLTALAAGRAVRPAETPQWGNAVDP